jgi:hypothetical protein
LEFLDASIRSDTGIKRNKRVAGWNEGFDCLFQQFVFKMGQLNLNLFDLSQT